MNLQPEVCVKVLGDILPGANLFRINLGKDENNIGLHFNPRFRENCIVCNDSTAGRWGQEAREKRFPFKQGTSIEISIVYDGKKFLIKLPDDYEFTFPNRHNYQKLDYMSVYGDFNVVRVDFE
ncbi:galectin-1-like isoform X2 [Sminthopsis crassicaudata]